MSQTPRCRDVYRAHQHSPFFHRSGVCFSWRKILSRNFGLGSRDMASAGRAAMSRLCKKGWASFATVDAVSRRWYKFVCYAKTHGIGRMERVTQTFVIAYGRGLADLVDAGEMTPAYAQVLLSSVNTVMTAATGNAWRSIGAVQDCQIARRSAIRKTAPAAIDRAIFESVLPFIQGVAGDRGVAVALLARELGLRSKEASLFDAKKVLAGALKTNSFRIEVGTKGGRARTAGISSERQLDALRFAAAVQRKDKSLVPSEKTFVQWLNSGLRSTRQMLAQHGLGGLHELRTSYACQRYRELAGGDAPCCGGKITDRKADTAARLTISAELGHRRIDIVAEYVGGRK
jgi:Integrase